MKIILNADDFGLTHEANLGIVKAFDEGFCSQASVVTNTNYFDEAVSIAEKNNFKHKVGLHINLSDGTPLTSGIKKLKQYARSDLFDYHPDFLHRVTPMYADVIAEEIEAQIQKYLSGGFSLMNIDSHHCAFYDIPVLYGLIPLLKNTNLNLSVTLETVFLTGVNGGISTAPSGRKKWISCIFVMQTIPAVWPPLIKTAKAGILSL